MKCVFCGTDNPDGALFCKKCGKRQDGMATCPSCGKDKGRSCGRRGA